MDSLPQGCMILRHFILVTEYPNRFVKIRHPTGPSVTMKPVIIILFLSRPLQYYPLLSTPSDFLLHQANFRCHDEGVVVLKLFFITYVVSSQVIKVAKSNHCLSFYNLSYKLSFISWTTNLIKLSQLAKMLIVCKVARLVIIRTIKASIIRGTV